jgi:hypothetical protein
MAKKPYKRFFDGFGFGYEQVELTGKCKRVTDGDHVFEYAQAQYRILGIPLWKYWIYKGDISWKEEKKVEYYDCEW